VAARSRAAIAYVSRGTPIAKHIVMAPILIVDDNPVNRLALSVLLRSLGVPHVVADSGATALEIFGKNEFSMVMMDLMMPGLDGFETARRLRAAEGGVKRRTPIVAVTAADLDGVRDRCADAGIDDILPKPIDAAVVAEKIAAWTRVAAPAVAQETVEEDLVETFLSVTRLLLAELDAAISSHDEPRIRRAAHELKGASLQVRAREIAQLCKQLESAAHDPDTTEILGVYTALAHAFTRVQAARPRVSALVDDANRVFAP
jgi:hypothetical protein